MRSRLTTSSEAGFTIIEVLVAALILALAALSTFGILASSVSNGQRAKATQVALDQAQQEIEKLHSLTFSQLAMTTTPSHAISTLNPNSRVVNGRFNLRRQAPEEFATMVVNGNSLYGGGFVEGGVVTPGPIPFESGDVTGQLYRYVVWRNDASCPESTVEAEDFCPGFQDYKQVVVAVKLDTPSNQSAERGYVEVQSEVIDPTSLNEGIDGGGDGGGGEGGDGEGEGGGGPHTGTAVTAQQFFLSDTSCAFSGVTVRKDIAGDHLLHNTLGTCAGKPQTGSKKGAPDALLLGGPPDPDPVDPANPALYDYSNDGYLEPTPDTDKGLQIRGDDTSGCHYVPTGTVSPESQVHRWISDPFTEPFKLNGKVTLEFYSRTLNDQLYHGTLCVYLFGRHETGPTETPTATDSLFERAAGAPYWAFTPEGNEYWPRNAWTEERLTMEFLAAPYTLPAGDRLGIALSVDPGNTDAEAIPIMYDHPNYRTRIEVDTTTPIDGG